MKNKDRKELKIADIMTCRFDKNLIEFGWKHDLSCASGAGQVTG